MSLIRRALISVSDKTGVVELGFALKRLGIEIISTGGSYKALTDAGVEATSVEDVTHFPEMMDGRVKTLHPAIHAGILARRTCDLAALNKQHIQPIDLVIVNLYPFAQTIAKPDCTFDQAIENIDVGGPTMIRAAAKNFNDVLVVVDPSDYNALIFLLENTKAISFEQRLALAHKAFEHTAHYDAVITRYFAENLSAPSPTPSPLNQFSPHTELRYGENPHQSASFYIEASAPSDSLANAKTLQGKSLSFNNLMDADTALMCIKALTSQKPACVIVKHANPCGVATANTLKESYLKAFSCDPTSAFGGIIAFNQTVDEETAKTLLNKQFIEVIIAPDFSDDAQKCFAAKPAIRLLATGPFLDTQQPYQDYKRLYGGLLVQTADTAMLDMNQIQTVTQRLPNAQELNDLYFAWKVCKFVKSNAIVYVKDEQTVGIGAGQTSRIASAQIGILNANNNGFSTQGAVLASDAFFPFKDSIEAAAKAGITAIIQPGGSIRDKDVIEEADRHNIAMVFTSMRHFRH